MLARISGAFVDVCFTIDSGPSSRAFASVLVDSIDAHTAVEARLFCALIDVDFAILS
jgi:hypothetical protein